MSDRDVLIIATQPQNHLDTESLILGQAGPSLRYRTLIEWDRPSDESLDKSLTRVILDAPERFVIVLAELYLLLPLGHHIRRTKPMPTTVVLADSCSPVPPPSISGRSVTNFGMALGAIWMVSPALPGSTLIAADCTLVPVSQAGRDLNGRFGYLPTDEEWINETALASLPIGGELIDGYGETWQLEERVEEENNEPELVFRQPEDWRRRLSGTAALLPSNVCLENPMARIVRLRDDGS